MSLHIDVKGEEMDKLGAEIAEELLESKKDDDVFNGRKRVALLTQKDAPWSQMEDEPTLWYERFAIYYLPLEQGNRSITRAYNTYAGLNVAAAPRPWYTARDKYKWEERAEAYDRARTRQRQELLEKVDVAIEDEIKNSLLVALRAAVHKVEAAPDDLDIRTAINAIPRLVNEIQNVYGVGSRVGATKSIEDLLKALPKGLTQKVMIYIDKRQQTQQLPDTKRDQSLSNDVIDGKIVEGKTVALPAKTQDAS